MKLDVFKVSEFFTKAFSPVAGCRTYPFQRQLPATAWAVLQRFKEYYSLVVKTLASTILVALGRVNLSNFGRLLILGRMNPIHASRWCKLLLLSFAAVFPPDPVHAAPNPTFRAGASAIDITPTNFPVIVNAMFEERTATGASDPLHARALALDDGHERLVIVVVDSCMLPRDLMDQAKELASAATGLPTDRILISATHTHSAPSAMGCLGSRVDAGYASYLPGRIAEGIAHAVKNLAPARIGWTAINDSEHTHCRRWIRRPDRLLKDPFGLENVRANMHPGYMNPDAIGPSGPVDPALSILAVQSPGGQPIAVLANYSMHYFGSPLLSADYYGLFATKIAALIGAEGGNGPFVGIMSQGTSGDQMWMDYGSPEKKISLDEYAQQVAEVAARAYHKIEYHDWVPLGIRQTKLTLGFRLPDEPRLNWAREVVTRMKDVVPHGMAEIYAKEAIYLHERPTAELILQAIRIGDLGIAAIPNEVYAISGLKIKAQSPFGATFVIELANGAEGYIPPPEQHALGGYTTWPARTAGLETNAEPRIVEASLRLLEEVSRRSRRRLASSHGNYAKATLAAKPLAYWRLEEFSGPIASDATGQNHDAEYETGIAFHLDGPSSAAFSGAAINRAAHFAGGRLKASLPKLRSIYSISFWFWNGLPNEARPVTGYLFSREGARTVAGDHLGLGGTRDHREGRLFFFPGNRLNETLTGQTVVKPRTWNQLVLVRQQGQVTLYLNGNPKPEISGAVEMDIADPDEHVFFGGRKDNFTNFEGKLDEVAVFDRALTATEVASLFQAASLASPTGQTLPGLQ